MPDQPPEQGPWTWDLPPSSATAVPRTGRSFGRTAALTVAGTVLPGLGLIAARRRVVGGVVLGVFALALVVLGVWAALDWQGLLAQFVKPSVLYATSSVLVVLALVWVGVVVASHLSLRGRTTRTQRVAGGLLVGVLAFAVAAPMAVAARYSYDTASSVQGVFKSQDDSRSATRPTLGGKPSRGATAKADPWADKPRLNVLLLGGDAGAGRTGTRTDTIILASIDTRTGDTTLFSLPRNTGRMPFPAKSKLSQYYPDGFTNGDGDDPEHFLNAMYDNVPNAVPKDVLGETDNLGADALKLSVGAALGLEVDYYVLINLQGFSKMINALGGITLNINSYIPIGGNTDLGIPPDDFLEPGPNRKLDGRGALWYARGRFGSDDFARMDRQRCVINAIIKQANPANMLARYEDVAKAGKQIVLTDMPQEVLPLMVDLSLRVKDGSVRSIVFKHGEDGFLSPDPDFDRMRQRVKVALGEAKATGPSGGATTKKPSASGGATAAKKPKKTESEDVTDSCAYNPEMAATATPYRG
ncbi:cell envelope-related function transcriptional attenuator common domain-containing protein [Friedmanniella luteola]|uniref:Cell envelope-related function transcriptional attenuator common domain-containing protein n=1 Tax=Friedmanniella luteola TaxID=546871 RepID=A0A1H1L4J8_9ACTN|nr:LCP family protein [Friedmanniella luteola]SDR69466.1 cell envelope-related function transcriptional attenuator common domain-containing protein [Friedmanniella luteola]